MTDMNEQKASKKSFFGKNMTFKNLFQELLSSLQRFRTQDVRFIRPMSYTTEPFDTQ